MYGLKFQNWFFGSHKASHTQIWILCPLWLCLVTLPTHRYHKNRGSMMSLLGEPLFVIDCQDISQVGHSYLLMSLWRFVQYAFGHVVSYATRL
jgi:hypothetical protein